jgi:hypothetical protein
MSPTYFDMRLRVLNDKGPLFDHLATISSSGARNGRAVQLMYLGWLVESGRIALPGGGLSPAASSGGALAQLPLSTPPHVAVDTDFAADDLLDTFGMTAG